MTSHSDSIAISAATPPVAPSREDLAEDASQAARDVEILLEPIRPSEDAGSEDFGSDAATEEIEDHEAEQEQGEEENSSDSDSEDGAAGEQDPNAPRRPRRAEIDPVTMTEEDRLVLKERVIKQVDFYFGDTHYPKDQFMLKHARADPAGFIDLAVVMAFKKMRRLTQFPSFVASCLVDSSIVLVSEDGTKLRRKAPVPRDPEDGLTRTVLIEHIAPDATPESLKKLFAPIGPIEQVRILNRNDPMPDDINKYIMKGYRQRIPTGLYPNARPIALVEFKLLEDTVSCCKQAPSTDAAWRSGMRLSILYRKPIKKKKTKKPQEEGARSATSSPAAPVVAVSSARPIVNRERAYTFGGFARSQGSGSPANSPATRRHPLANDGINPPILALSGSPATRRHPLESTGSRGSLRSLGVDNPTRSTRADSPSSWRSDSNNTSRRVTIESPGPLHLQNVVREPKGPDGSVGFGAGRGRPLELRS
jgi:hypothetical protein